MFVNSARDWKAGLIPGFIVSNKTANLLAYNFLQAVFLSAKWSLPLW